MTTEHALTRRDFVGGTTLGVVGLWCGLVAPAAQDAMLFVGTYTEDKRREGVACSDSIKSTAMVNTSGSTIILGAGVASGINNAGIVVGTIDSGAFMWKAGTKTFLTYARANTLWTVKKALKINNRGQILAQADDSLDAVMNHWVILTPIVP